MKNREIAHDLYHLYNGIGNNCKKSKIMMDRNGVKWTLQGNHGMSE